MSDLQMKGAGSDVSVDFRRFEGYLKALDLPTENIIAPPEERLRIMNALPEFVASLPPEVRKNARYLSKFIAGSAVGLFDASLNFVWNEVVVNLRKKAVLYGLEIFYDEAIGAALRDQYKDEEDLASVKDKTLLDTCLKLELISDLVYKKLAHILDMRNDIGSSHPNVYSINSYELLGWLQTCINEVLREEVSSSAITVRSIVENIKKAQTKLDRTLIEGFGQSLADVSSNLVGNLMTTIFGIFVSPKTTPIVRENILQIAPIVWNRSKDERKYDLGFSVDAYRKVLDDEKVKLAEVFFEACDGNRYFSVNTRSVAISNLLDDLSRVHDERDNYYHEVPIARRILTFIRQPEDIPEDRIEKTVRTFLVCRIGREVGYQNGVSHSARALYDSFFKIINKDQVIVLLKLLNEQEISSSLYGDIRKGNLKTLLALIKSPVHGSRINEIIDVLISLERIEHALHTREYQEVARGLII